MKVFPCALELPEWVVLVVERHHAFKLRNVIRLALLHIRQVAIFALRQVVVRNPCGEGLWRVAWNVLRGELGDELGLGLFEPGAIIPIFLLLIFNWQ